MKFKNLFSVFIQDTVHKRKQLTKKQCEQWLGLVAKNQSKITIRIVSENESKKLNKQFRNKDVATNVLSFPNTPPTPQTWRRCKRPARR